MDFFVLILVVFFFVLFLLSLHFGQISPLAFFRWFTTTSDRNAKSCNRIPSNYCLPSLLSIAPGFWPSKPLAGLGRIWNRYLLTMFTWNRRDSTPLSAAPRAIKDGFFGLINPSGLPESGPYRIFFCTCLIGIILRWGFLIWELIFIYCGLFCPHLGRFFLIFFKKARSEIWPKRSERRNNTHTKNIKMTKKSAINRNYFSDFSHSWSLSEEATISKFTGKRSTYLIDNILLY